MSSHSLAMIFVFDALTLPRPKFFEACNKSRCQTPYQICKHVSQFVAHARYPPHPHKASRCRLHQPTRGLAMPCHLPFTWSRKGWRPSPPIMAPCHHPYMVLMALESFIAIMSSQPSIILGHHHPYTPLLELQARNTTSFFVSKFLL